MATSGARRTGHRIWLLADARSQPVSKFGSFCQSQGVFHIDPQISDRAFNLRMSKQDLDRAEVSGRLIDDGRLRPPQRVRAIILARQADARTLQGRVAPSSSFAREFDMPEAAVPGRNSCSRFAVCSGGRTYSHFVASSSLSLQVAPGAGHDYERGCIGRILRLCDDRAGAPEGA